MPLWDSQLTWRGSENGKGKAKGLAFSALADACNMKCSSFHWVAEVVLGRTM